MQPYFHPGTSPEVPIFLYNVNPGTKFYIVSKTAYSASVKLHFLFPIKKAMPRQIICLPEHSL